MKKTKISTQALKDAIKAPQYEFPKYTTQFINLINGNAGGTRPKVVGQMSDLIQNFPGQTIDEWILWYDEQQPDAIDKAVDLILKMYNQMRTAFAQIDEKLIRQWVKDLVYSKTFCGLKFQEAILKHIATELNKTYRLASKEEEAQNIDGYIGDTPVQIKSSTYKTKNTSEVITVSIIYYSKKKDGIVIEYDPEIFI